LREAVVGFLAGLVLAFIAASIAETVTGYKSGDALPVAVTVADVAALWIGLIGAAVYASRHYGLGSLTADFGLKIGSLWDVVVGAAIGVAGQYLVIPAIYWPFEQLDHGLAHSLSQPAHQDVAAAHGDVQVAVLMLFLAIGAPFVEETFFRGLVLRGLLDRLPVAAAIIVSALAFALAHFEPLQFAGLAVFGAILGVLAWRTGRLAPGIAAHAAFNAAAVLSIAHFG
jgi:membrane protease YdiL (CAAX protease family)